MRKAIIALFLLITYSAGLAHEIIPHSHHQLPDSFSGNFHHGGIAAEYHSDTACNLYLVISGIPPTNGLSKSGMPANCNMRFLFVPSLTHGKNKQCDASLQHYPMVVVMTTLFEPHFLSKPNFAPEGKLQYSSPLLKLASVRGPPEFLV